MKALPTQRGAQVPLSNKQKAAISKLARQAWVLLKQRGATDESESDYRGREAIAACGRRVSEALNGDFEILEAHFLANAGKTGRAFTSAMKAESNGARQARFKITKLLAKHGLPDSYAAKIMQDKFKTTLDAASEKQLWAVYYDCQRGTKAHKNTAPGHAVKASGGSVMSLMQQAQARFGGTKGDTIPF